MPSDNNHIMLSILIPTMPERQNDFLDRIVSILEPQIEGKPVELLILSDNRTRSIGSKRNVMIDIAQGEYICFVDDDDVVSDDYVDSILDKITENSDVIVFNGIITMDERNPKLIRFGKEFNKGEIDNVYFRRPNHLMVHKKSNISERYKDLKHGEDSDWAERQLKHIKTESKIDKVLYHYDYRRTTKKHTS
jgi:glycosyltransferase involved in cell wall biosynthesis